MHKITKSLSRCVCACACTGVCVRATIIIREMIWNAVMEEYMDVHKNDEGFEGEEREMGQLYFTFKN